MQNSKIEWTDHTFNIVWGCQRVSPGCQHCYAETLAHRYGYNVWGPARTTERRTMSDNYWRQPIKWNEQARQAGERRRVFCGSMSDVFEDHLTNDRERERLWKLIEATPHLDWLLLTKRPEDITSHIPIKWRFHGGAPANVWYGTSIERDDYTWRADELRRAPAAVRFISAEPLLSALPSLNLNGISWLIAGGESGHGARPLDPDWIRSLRDQCAGAGTAFFVKQMGSAYMLGKRKGGELRDIPADLRIREFPNA